MNPNINPEVALKSVNEFLEELEEKRMLEKHYKEGSEELDRLIKEIEGLLRVMFSDSKKRISQYYNAYSRSGMSERDKQIRYIRKVKRTENNLLSLKKELNLYISSRSEEEDKGEEDKVKSPTTQMNFHNIEHLALGNINNYNTTIYFNALITAIKESEDIPIEEKKDLIDKIKDIATNPYVSGIGTGLIVKALKSTLMGK